MDNLQQTSFSLIVLPPLLFIAFLSVLFYFLFYKPMASKITTLERSKTYMDSTYLRKIGATSTYGDGKLGKDFINYDLRSWDGGKNWYAVDYNFETKELKILGEAETVYPKLLKHLAAWDKLTEHAQNNGAIKDASDTIGISLLKEAGFTVKKHDN